MLLWGKNVVKEAILSGKPIEKIYLNPSSKGGEEILSLALEKNIPVQKRRSKELKHLVGHRKTQGVVALLKEFSFSSLSTLITKIKRKKSFCIFLDSLCELENIGVILRTLEALGGEGAIFKKENRAPFLPRLIRSSSGAIFHLTLVESPSVKETLSLLEKEKIAIYLLDPQGENIQKIAFSFPLCLVLGKEGEGISQEFYPYAKEVVSIPMQGKVGSLNVASSSAIALWEIFKQKSP